MTQPTATQGRRPAVRRRHHARREFAHQSGRVPRRAVVYRYGVSWGATAHGYLSRLDGGPSGYAAPRNLGEAGKYDLGG